MSQPVKAFGRTIQLFLVDGTPNGLDHRINTWLDRLGASCDAIDLRQTPGASRG